MKAFLQTPLFLAARCHKRLRILQDSDVIGFPAATFYYSYAEDNKNVKRRAKGQREKQKRREKGNGFVVQYIVLDLSCSLVISSGINCVERA